VIEQHREVVTFLREAGADAVRMEMGGKHARVVFEWRGREQFYVLPGTPSDSRRGAKNSISDIRHMLGLVVREKQVGTRRVHRIRAPQQSPALGTIGSLPDWRPTILSHPAVDLAAQLDFAFLNLWRECMRRAGSQSRL
jgi:hypothetical protein